MRLWPPRRRGVVGEVRTVLSELQRRSESQWLSTLCVREQFRGVKASMKLKWCLDTVGVRSSLGLPAPSPRPRRNGKWLRYTVCGNGEGTHEGRKDTAAKIVLKGSFIALNVHFPCSCLRQHSTHHYRTLVVATIPKRQSSSMCFPTHQGPRLTQKPSCCLSHMKT